MGAFHLFHQVVPASSLYLHSVMVDVGGSLPLQAQMTGCDVNSRPAEIVFSSLDLAAPWPRETLNKLYNACDCLVSTAHGEGWGLTTTEAMCAGIPVVVPYNTANIDILGENQERGWGVRAGGDLDHTVFIYANGGSPVATIHADSFVSQLQYVYDCPEIAAEKAMLARAWALENTWEKRENEWIQLLQVLKSQLETTSS
jgi:glycosyltransferase involved in cell wall biosynthesis